MITLDIVYQSIKQHINIINTTSNNCLLSNGFYRLMFHKERILILILWLVCKLHYSVESCLLIFSVKARSSNLPSQQMKRKKYLEM